MRWRRLALGTLATMLAGAALPAAAADCPPITQSQEKALLRYVRAKYKLSAHLPLRVVKDGAIGKTCYERIRFVSTDPARYFNYGVVLLPDHVFFARELVDSSADPLAEEREKNQATQARLLSGNPAWKGPASATVSIVIFSDFQCPYCVRAAQSLQQAISTAGVPTRLVFRHFPLPFHNWALPAAKAAACAHAQSPDAFWKLHDYYFEHQTVITAENVSEKSLELAKTLPRVDAAEYKKCLQSPSTEAIINKDVELGKEIGVRGTPTIFVNGQRTAEAELMRAIRNAAPQPQAAKKFASVGQE